MVFDILAMGLLLWAWWYVRACAGQSCRVSKLPAADQPPPAAEEALPHGRRLTQYVEGGLEEIDEYLRRDEAA